MPSKKDNQKEVKDHCGSDGGTCCKPDCPGIASESKVKDYCGSDGGTCCKPGCPGIASDSKVKDYCGSYDGNCCKPGCPGIPPPSKPIRTRPKRLWVRKPTDDGNKLRRVNSRELRGGVVFTDCDCNRRNGLQLDCPRDHCGGNKCLTTPWPECEMGKYYKKKWSRYDALRMRQREPAYCVPFEYDLTRRYAEK